MAFSISKANTFFSTLNFALCFVGYQLATSLFLPVSSDMEGVSRAVTVPYRAFALLISLFVIFLNVKKKVEKTPLAVKILWIYWITLIIRIFYDTNVRNDVLLNNTAQLWLYIFGMILPAMISVIKSYRMIDLNKALKWVFSGVVLTLILSLFNNDSLLMSSEEITGRAEGNLALNTIYFGHLGTMGIVFSLYFLSRGRMDLIKKIALIGVMLLSLLVMIRAGSRSPVLALIVISLFCLFARGKNIVVGTFITIVVLVLAFVFFESLLSLIGNVSPVLEYRLRAGVEGDSSGRDLLYQRAFQAFLENPILGSQFALFEDGGGFIYSHNIILDSLMGLGLFGGLGMTYILWAAVKRSYRLVKVKDPHFWICLMLIQQIVLSLLSGAFYYNPILNVLLVFVFLYSKSSKNFKRLVL